VVVVWFAWKQSQNGMLLGSIVSSPVLLQEKSQPAATCAERS
jgi:hypothetical protein